jgi:hypothetical protein
MPSSQPEQRLGVGFGGAPLRGTEGIQRAEMPRQDAQLSRSWRPERWSLPGRFFPIERVQL